MSLPFLVGLELFAGSPFQSKLQAQPLPFALDVSVVARAWVFERAGASGYPINASRYAEQLSCSGIGALPTMQA
jgi:hypothetical protein